MTGDDVRTIRQTFELGRTKFALLLGYIGNDRNNNLRVRRLESEELVPLYMGRFIWLLQRYREEHDGNLPSWPTNLKIEGEHEPWA